MLHDTYATPPDAVLAALAALVQLQ